jgi:single-stranded DNA-binding protein
MRTYGIVRIAKSITYQNGVAKFTIAHNDYKKDGHFFNAVAFKGTGEVIFNNCKIGDRIFIDGEILNNNYKNKDDEMVYQNQVVIHRFEFIEKKEKDSFANTSAEQTYQDIHGRKNDRQREYESVDVKDKEILPF